ncbi:DUF6065 family protein [Undibacterium sp. Rencai35W]|uniref:DUF6065 family protein n=1 Tax=Undibacterium sp. Rencai35W TaxID=3413046 RepID=UPI003BF34A60
MSLSLFFKSDLMEFYCDPELFGVIPEPVPAIKMVPDWFKKIRPTSNSGRDQFGSHGATAKKCMPLVDAMGVGFIIPLWGDTNVRTNGDGSLIEVGGNPLGPIIEFHNKEQLGGKSSPTYPGPAIKFINHWVIKTAPGYSTLFMPPLNHIDPRFTCLSGLVDTDKYPKEVNFPAIWHAKNHDAMLSAGTPLVTCIPMRRKDLRGNCKPRAKTQRESAEIEQLKMKQQSRMGVYTNELREPRK